MPKPAKAKTLKRPDARSLGFPIPVSQPSNRQAILWTPTLLKQVIRRADAGDMSLVADLCEQIVADDRFGELLAQLADDVLGSELTFEKSLRTIVGSAEKAEDLADDWPIGYEDDELKSIIIWALITGVAFAKHETWIEAPSGRIVPVLRWWHPQHFSYRPKDGVAAYTSTGSDLKNHCWHVRGPDGGWTAINPGDGKWLIVTRRSDYRPWANGLWRGLGVWWLLKQYAMVDMGIHSEKASKVIVTSSPDSTAEERKQIAQYVYEAGKDPVIALPVGFDIKLLEVKANLEWIYTSQIELANKSASITVLGQNLSTDVSGGSLAATKEHSSKESRRVRNAATLLSKVLHGQSLSWWAEFNYGRADLAPFPRWHTEPATDYSSKATALFTASQALVQLKNAGWSIDEAQLEEEYGLVLKKLPDPLLPDPRQMVIPGSESPAQPPQPPGKQSVVPKTRKEPKHSALFLASGDNPAEAKGFVRGQLYVDELSDNSTALAADELSGFVNRIIKAIDGAEDYEGIRAAVIKTFRNEADPDRLAQLVEYGLLLANMAGRFAVDEDLPETT